MAARLSTIVKSELDTVYLLTIDDADYVGSATDFSMTDLRVEWRGEPDQNNPRFSPIIGSECSMTLVINSTTLETFAEDLFGADEGRFSVRLTNLYGGSLVYFEWYGYILPDLITLQDVPVTDPGYELTIKATDGLGRLKSIDYNNAGVTYTGKDTFIGHILNCLNKLDFVGTYFTSGKSVLRTVVNWHDSRWTYAATTNPLVKSRVSHAAFYHKDTKGNIVYKSCYDVLKEIARAWGARFMFSGSGFWLIQPNEYASGVTTKRFFGYQPNGTGATSTDDFSIDNIPGSGSSEILRFSGGTWQFFPALKSVQVDYQHIAAQNLIPGAVWSDTISPVTTYTVDYIDSGLGTATLSFEGLINGTTTFLIGTPEAHFIVFELYIDVGNRYLSRTVSISGGFANYGTASWSLSDTARYQIAVPVIPYGNGQFAQGVNFITPPLTANGELAIKFELDSLDIYDTDGNGINGSGDISVSYDLSGAYLEYIGNGVFSDQSDIYQFGADNDASASTKVELTTLIGDGPNLVSPGHIETEDDASAWDLAAGEWTVGGAGTAKAHSQLLVNEIIKGQLSPVRRMVSMSFQDLTGGLDPLLPHRCITYDSGNWVAESLTYDCKTDIISGEWFKIQSASTYTERDQKFVPKDSSSGAPTSGSSGGTQSGGTTPTTGGGVSVGNTSLFFAQEYIEQSTATLTWTENSGILPEGNHAAQIRVFQNGQRLLTTQYTVTLPNDIEIDAATHYSGANYLIEAIIVQ